MNTIKRIDRLRFLRTTVILHARIPSKIWRFKWSIGFFTT